MAKSYGRKNPTPHRGSVLKQLLVVLGCFLLGYLSASVFDFTSVSGWVNTQLVQRSGQGKTKPIQQAQLPKPKFEFYTLLASEHTQVSGPGPNPAPTVPAPQVVAQIPPVGVPLAKNAPVSVATEVPPKPLPSQQATINKDGYLVQIGSFKSRQEAERMKASLTLKGFAVNIAQVNQQQTNWYRVVIGPFASRSLAEKARTSLARSERIVGMIRKMNA